jgi:hypothetical protein
VVLHKGTVRKNTHKESSREKSHGQGQSLMAGPNCQAGQGERWRSTDSGPGVAFIEEGGRKLAHAWASLLEAELVLEREFLFKGGAVLGSFSSEV